MQSHWAHSVSTAAVFLLSLLHCTVRSRCTPDILTHLWAFPKTWRHTIIFVCCTVTLYISNRSPSQKSGGHSNSIWNEMFHKEKRKGINLSHDLALARTRQWSEEGAGALRMRAPCRSLPLSPALTYWNLLPIKTHKIINIKPTTASRTHAAWRLYLERFSSASTWKSKEATVSHALL